MSNRRVKKWARPVDYLCRTEREYLQTLKYLHIEGHAWRDGESLFPQTGPIYEEGYADVLFVDRGEVYFGEVEHAVKHVYGYRYIEAASLLPPTVTPLMKILPNI